MRLKDEKFYKTVRDFLDIYLIKHRGYSLIGFAEIQIARYPFYKITLWCGTTALLNITEVPT